MKNNLNNEFSSKAFEHLINVFVMPEVKKRQEVGELEKPLNLLAAQIIFFPDGKNPLIRINSEVKGIANVKYKKGISKKPNEPVFGHEIEGLKDFNRLEDDYPNSGHATIIRIDNRWGMFFDFRYNKSLAKVHIETAKQFYEAAEFSFKKKHWSPFIDNLFSAAELSVKSILLSIADPKIGKHKTISMKFNRFADLGNIKPKYKQTFNKLYGLRVGARYLKEKIMISEIDAQQLLKNVKNMIADISHRIGIKRTR